jgi:exopolysaccharide production protein ExoY
LDLLRVPPGLTGLWQISGRSNTTYSQRVYYDIKYGDTCCFWGDVSLILRTVPVVLLGRGAM